MDSGFELFTEKGHGGHPSGTKSAPAISIGKNATIRINEAAYAALGQPRYIEFLYNKERQVLAIRSLKRPKAHAYTVNEKAKNKIISCKDLLQYFDIIPVETTRYRTSSHDENTLMVELQNPLPKSRVGRRNG